MNDYLEAALKLHQYLVKKHWNGQAVVGPDPIGKINWRITRFIKSYTPWLPWSSKLVYLQGQSYWIKSNLLLAELTHQSTYLEFVVRCADYMVQSQPENGAWLHPPIWERRGFISTVEGVWASLGLVAAYRQTHTPAYLEAALKWYNFQINSIGFQNVKDGLAANYYAHSISRVPNVTTMLIWLTGELADVTGDKKYLHYTDKMLRFIEDSQLTTGELPYALGPIPHFMCYQYNSFQFIDLAHYYRLTNDVQALSIMNKLIGFLATGLTERGSSRYNCFKDTPEVNYWTAALSAALRHAHTLKLGDYLALSERSYRYLLQRQRRDSSFDFSEFTYGFLTDRCSYPRYLSMILNHLLFRAQTEVLKPAKVLDGTVPADQPVS